MDISRIRLASSEIYPGTSTSLLFLCIFVVGQTGAFVADFSCSSIQTKKKGHRIDPAGAEKQQALFVALKQTCHPGAALDLLGFLTGGPGATASWGPKSKEMPKIQRGQSMQLSVAVCCFGFVFALLCELKHCHEQGSTLTMYCG